MVGGAVLMSFLDGGGGRAVLMSFLDGGGASCINVIPGWWGGGELY